MRIFQWILATTTENNIKMFQFQFLIPILIEISFFNKKKTTPRSHEICNFNIQRYNFGKKGSNCHVRRKHVVIEKYD
jgi:hypothetical protein